MIPEEYMAIGLILLANIIVVKIDSNIVAATVFAAETMILAYYWNIGTEMYPLPQFMLTIISIVLLAWRLSK